MIAVSFPAQRLMVWALALFDGQMLRHIDASCSNSRDFMGCCLQLYYIHCILHTMSIQNWPSILRNLAVLLPLVVLHSPHIEADAILIHNWPLMFPNCVKGRIKKLLEVTKQISLTLLRLYSSKQFNKSIPVQNSNWLMFTLTSLFSIKQLFNFLMFIFHSLNTLTYA